MASPTQWTKFEQTPGVGDGQGGLVCCDWWGCKESDTTERVNWTDANKMYGIMSSLWVLYLILQLTILNKLVPEFACWEVCFVNKMGPNIYVSGRETESNQKWFRCRGWQGGGQVQTSSPNFESNLWSRSQLHTQFPWQSDTFLWGYWEGRDRRMTLMGHFQMGSEPRAPKEGRETKKS